DECSVPSDDLRLLPAGHRLAAEDPGPAQGAAADHDGRAPGGGDHRPGVGEAPHVAVAGDGDADAVDDGCDDLPRCQAGELLGARARVDGDRVHALALGDPRDLDVVHGAVVPAA